MDILSEEGLSGPALTVQNDGRRRGRECMRARNRLDHRWSQCDRLVRRQERTAIGQKLRCGHATMMYRSDSVHPWLQCYYLCPVAGVINRKYQSVLGRWMLIVGMVLKT